MPKRPMLTQANERMLHTIEDIADRAVAFYRRYEIAKIDRTSVLLDILTTHTKIMPLDLDAMLDGEDTDFIHDIAGINRHLDREHYKLTDCFLPRFARMHHD